MGSITNVFIRAREFALRRTHGRTITEYTRPERMSLLKIPFEPECERLRELLAS